MKIEIFKPEVYRETKIYYRNFLTTWEYLVTINNEIYQSHITVNPTFVRRLLFFLGIEKALYTDEQKKEILTQLKRMGQSTVDYVIGKDVDQVVKEVEPKK